MGLLTAIHRRPRYVVTVPARPAFPVEAFRTLWEAREYADYLASTEPGFTCVISHGTDKEIVPRSAFEWFPDGGGRGGGDGDGSSGVREPRRPLIDPSAGSIALDLPE
jgi:hypothetical protein